MNMAEKKICDVCHKKINGINSIANIVGDSILCSRCYEQLGGFRITRKYNSEEEMNNDKIKSINEAIKLHYPQSVIYNLEKHFENHQKYFEAKKEMQSYLMTTGTSLEGYHIEKYLGIVVGHVVIGGGFGSGFEASIASFAGDETTMLTEKLDQAKEVAQNRAVIKSIQLGGNALIGIDVEFSTFSQDLMGVVFTGTSVKVRKKDD